MHLNPGAQTQTVMEPVIVSAYYKIPSKKSHAFYVGHLRRWFKGVCKPPVVFFTTDDMVVEMQGWGLPLTNVRFVMLPFESLTSLRRYGREFWDRQKARDVEPYHTPELGIIWDEKKYFVQRAMEMTPDARVFIWCDAGCVRDAQSVAALNHFSQRGRPIDDDRLHLQLLRNIPSKSFYRFPDQSIAGAIQAGNRTAWTQHITLSETVLANYDAAEVPAIMDQYILLSCANTRPDLYVLHTRPPNVMVNEWFFFLGYL